MEAELTFEDKVREILKSDLSAESKTFAIIALYDSEEIETNPYPPTKLFRVVVPEQPVPNLSDVVRVALGVPSDFPVGKQLIGWRGSNTPSQWVVQVLDADGSTFMRFFEDDELTVVGELGGPDYEPDPEAESEPESSSEPMTHDRVGDRFKTVLEIMRAGGGVGTSWTDSEGDSGEIVDVDGVWSVRGSSGINLHYGPYEITNWVDAK